MVYHLTRGMTGKPKQWIGTRPGMYMHGEKSILQQIKSSWLCGPRWSNPNLLVTKAVKAMVSQTSFVLFFLEIGLD